MIYIVAQAVLNHCVKILKRKKESDMNKLYNHVKTLNMNDDDA